MSLLIRRNVVGRYVANDITLQRHYVLLPARRDERESRESRPGGETSQVWKDTELIQHFQKHLSTIKIFPAISTLSNTIKIISNNFKHRTKS